MSAYHRNNPDSPECQQMERENRYAAEVLREMDKPRPKPVSFSILETLDELKSGQWWLYRVEAEMSDGSIIEGTVQGACAEADVFAPETWEADEP